MNGQSLFWVDSILCITLPLDGRYEGKRFRIGAPDRSYRGDIFELDDFGKQMHSLQLTKGHNVKPQLVV